MWCIVLHNIKCDEYILLFNGIGFYIIDRHVFFQERDKFWERELDVLEHRYEYSVKHPRSDTYGMIVLSKLEMIDPDSDS